MVLLKICSLKFCDIWQYIYFYRILNNATFKMEVEQILCKLSKNETHSQRIIIFYFSLLHIYSV